MLPALHPFNDPELIRWTPIELLVLRIHLGPMGNHKESHHGETEKSSSNRPWDKLCCLPWMVIVLCFFVSTNCIWTQTTCFEVTVVARVFFEKFQSVEIDVAICFQGQSDKLQSAEINQ